MESPAHMLEDEMSKAISYEKNKQPKEAARICESLLKQHPGNTKILERLIINYRKIKDYKKELKHINALIKVHQAYYLPRQKKGAAVISISSKLNKLLRPSDLKDGQFYVDDTIKKLEKRKSLVEKKIDEAQN